MNRALAVGAIAALLGGCTGAGPPAARPGDTWVLLTREATPSGLVEHREAWVLADTAQGQGRFEVHRDGAVRFSEWRALGPGTWPRGAGRAWTAATSGAERRVRVPAGTYRCRRTVRGHTEREGRVMRVDEWWTPGVPVPVQRWTRWQGLPDDRFHRPPARPGDLLLGSEWTVLERAPRR